MEVKGHERILKAKTKIQHKFLERKNPEDELIYKNYKNSSID